MNCELSMNGITKNVIGIEMEKQAEKIKRQNEKVQERCDDMKADKFSENDRT